MNKFYLKWLFFLSFITFSDGKDTFLSPEDWKGGPRHEKGILLPGVEYVESKGIHSRRFLGISLEKSISRFDPYWDEMTPDEYEDFRMASNQKYVGVGIELSKLSGRVVVSQVFPQGTAEKAGILPGDFIVGVDGKRIRRKHLSKVSERIQGTPGSYVEISVKRTGEPKPLHFRIKRLSIALPAVTGVELKAGRIGYLKLRKFTEEADKEMAKAIRHLKNEGMRALVVDLRDNPGGRLDIAVNIVEYFLEKEERIVSVKMRQREEKTLLARSGKQLFHGPLVVLINRVSASASEILAGSLRDHGRATLVGENSFGKNSIQTVHKLNGGSARRQTTAHYLLPKGEAIHRTGLSPDVKALFSEEDRVRLMIQNHYLQQMDVETFSSKFGFEPVIDRSLDMALKVLEARLLLLEQVNSHQ